MLLLLWLALGVVAVGLWIACGALVKLRADHEALRAKHAEIAHQAAEAHAMASQAYVLTGSVARYVIAPLGNKPS